MTEPQQPTGGQEPQAGQGQEPSTEPQSDPQVEPATEPQTDPQGEPQEPQTGSEPAGKVDDLPEWAQTLVKDLRQESADKRTKLKAYEDRDKSEADKVAEERDNLKTENEKLRQGQRRSAFVENIGLPSARLAWNALSDAGVELEFDENERPTNESLEAARKSLKQYDPTVFGDGSVNGGDRGSEPQVNDMNAQIRAAAGR